MPLDPALIEDLRKYHTALVDEGKLLSQTQLQTYYQLFRERFGPEVLRNLDGEVLLSTMHDHSNRDSLVYWLEFKNDNEFPPAFGRIGGGSALKFGIYRRKETGAWMTGSPQAQREITIQEAIDISRRHRDQLLLGVELLDKFPGNGTDGDYARLQHDMEQAAPDVNDTAWGHKYFSLLFPSKLDDFHSPDYQRFHLIKLLQIPPTTAGRYASAGRYVAAAAELNIPLNHFTHILNERHGRPHAYWRMLANYQEEGFQHNWDLMRDGGYAAIGWAKLGDLSDLQHDRESKGRLQTLMKTHYGNKGGWENEVFNFVTGFQEGDLVLAFEASTVLGIGRVVGPYVYDTSVPNIPHRRAVDWLSVERWELPISEALGRTVKELKRPENLVEIERRILGATPIAPVPKPIVGPTPPAVIAVPRLSGIAGRVQSILERKGQVILYGPPGTGKTYWAMRTARDLAAYYRFALPYAGLTDEQKAAVIGTTQQADGLVRTCTFHPAYGYEDFLEGYRPISVNDQLAFERRDGVFKRICEDARKNPSCRYYLIIDEINRGDIPRIFGELLTVLEKDKRCTPILLPLSGTPFHVPDNVYLIGTMNTADRSIALLDTALRRRFGFVELMPDSSVLGNTIIKSIPIGPWLDALNQRLRDNIGRDARNLQVGHAYLLAGDRPITDFAHFAHVVQDDLLPLLEEYCYEDYAALEKILGTDLIDGAHQRVRHDLFEPARQDELVTALLQQCPELSALPQVVTADAEQTDESDVDDGAPGDNSSV